MVNEIVSITRTNERVMSDFLLKILRSILGNEVVVQTRLRVNFFVCNII